VRGDEGGRASDSSSPALATAGLVESPFA